MNTTELREEVRRIWLGPSSQILLTDEANLLARANRVLEETVFPGVIKLLEDYCIQRERLTLSSSQQRYAIPARAFNMQLRRAEWRSSSTSDPMEIDVLKPIDAIHYGTGGAVSGFYLEGDEIVIVGTPSGYLDVHYPLSPGKLTPSTNWRTVATVTPGSYQITVDSVAEALWSAGDKLDVCDSQRSGLPRYLSLEVQSVTSSTITFTSEIAGATYGTRAIEVGDYVAAEGYAARPMVPEPLHASIAQGVAALTAQAMGDVEAFQIAEAKFLKTLADQLKDLDQRVEQRRVFVNYNSRFRRLGRLPHRRRRFVL